MSASNNRPKPVKCKICDKKYVSKDALIDHIGRIHSSNIPEGWSPARYENYLRTGKTEGHCVYCKKETGWNEATGKYNRMCGSEACKKKARELAQKNYIGLHGKPYTIDDPEVQKKMIYSKKNSGKYIFEDPDTGKKYTAMYDSSYGRDFFEMIDTLLSWDGADIIAPSPHTYYYEYDGKKHFYIPDAYSTSLNLEIEFKDGGSNPNTHPKIQSVDKEKERLKDKVMDSLKGKVNYIKICNKDYREFFTLLSKLRSESSCPLPPWESRLEPLGESTIIPSVGGEVSKVYFTKEITPESLIRIYGSLGVLLSGKVAVKISTGEYGGHNFLQPYLIKQLVDSVSGTIVECNTAYPGKRNTTKAHWETIKAHGFYDITPCQILDEYGEFSIPIENGYHLKENIVGIGLKDYNSIIMLSHFKGHTMAGFGGALKNMSIGLASSSGKANIHTGGTGTTFEDIMNADRDTFLDSMVDADMAIMDYMGPENIVYINIMNNISVDCDCSDNPKAPSMKDIGIFASFDPVALDQACIDAIYISSDPGKDEVIERIESRNGLRILSSANAKGLGNREYTLEDIDIHPNPYTSITEATLRNKYKSRIVRYVALKDPVLNYDDLILYYRDQIFHKQLSDAKWKQLYDEMLQVRDYLKKIANSDLEHHTRLQYEANKALIQMNNLITYMEESTKISRNRRIVTESDVVDPTRLFYLSSKNMDGKTIKPTTKPDDGDTQWADNVNTPRIPFYKSIDGALKGMYKDIDYKNFYIHIPNSTIHVDSPDVIDVPDRLITSETWVLDPVELKCIGKIHVNAPVDKEGVEITDGDKIKTAYKWTWEWVEEYPTMESSKSTNTKPIYIVSVKYKSPFSIVVRKATNSQFNHTCIALTEDLERMFTFTRSSEFGVVFGSRNGFCMEPLSELMRKDKDCIIKVTKVFVPEDAYRRIENGIKYYIEHGEDTTFNYRNLLRIGFGIKVDNKDLDDYSLNCSVFVDKILKDSGIDISGKKESNLVTPEDLSKADTIYNKAVTVYYGPAKDYDKRKIKHVVLETTHIEATKDDTAYYPVFIFLSYTNTSTARLIKAYTHDPYSHSSISFDPSLTNMLSFNKDGFVQENILGTFYKERSSVVKYSLYMYLASKEEYHQMKSYVNQMLSRKGSYKYNALGLTNFIFGRGSDREDKFFCSEFIASVISASNNDIFDRPPYMVSPYYFAKNKNFIFITRGKLKSYSEKKVTKIVQNILTERGYTHVNVKDQ